MNKNTLIGAIVAVVVIVGAVTFFMLNGSPKTATSTPEMGSQTSSDKLSAAKACELLTLAEAKQLMGESTTVGSNTAPANGDDINVDTCSYTNNAASVPGIRIATIMVRSALTGDGLTSNKEAFEAGGAANPSGATAIEGYGEKAFWDPATHQLAVLKGNLWIGIVYGGTNPSTNTLEDAKKVADVVAK